MLLEPTWQETRVLLQGPHPEEASGLLARAMTLPLDSAFKKQLCPMLDAASRILLGLAVCCEEQTCTRGFRIQTRLARKRIYSALPVRINTFC